MRRLPNGRFAVGDVFVDLPLRYLEGDSGALVILQNKHLEPVFEGSLPDSGRSCLSGADGNEKNGKG